MPDAFMWWLVAGAIVFSTIALIVLGADTAEWVATGASLTLWACAHPRVRKLFGKS